MWQNTVTCDVGTAQCEDGTIKYEKKTKGTTKCGKYGQVLRNVRIIPLNVRKK